MTPIKQYGICHLSVIPVRADHADASEIVTQLLFGETFAILQTHNQWLHIQISHDKYRGWIDNKQYLPISEIEATRIQQNMQHFSADMIHALEATSFPYAHQQAHAYVVKGSPLPNWNRSRYCRMAGTDYQYRGKTVSVLRVPPYSVAIRLLLNHAISYLNTPYLWGGRTPLGIDCSGFTQVVYRMIGVSLWRDSIQQEKQGTEVANLQAARAGDLTFFSKMGQEKIIHVGILLAQRQTIIHASGQVRIDKIDHKGIFNEQKQTYTHQLQSIRRMI